MPSETKKFQQDLLASVRQMRRGEAARVTKVKLPPAAEARARTGLSQHDFARLLGVSARTLQDWEQGRREPTGAAGRCCEWRHCTPKSFWNSTRDARPFHRADAFRWLHRLEAVAHVERRPPAHRSRASEAA